MLAELPRCIALGGLVTTPVVAKVSADFLSRAEANPDEVSCIFSVPLRQFLQSEGHKHKDISAPPNGYRVRMHSFTHTMSYNDTSSHAAKEGKQYKIFGLTASILIRVAMLAFGEPPPFAFALPAGDVPSKL